MTLFGLDVFLRDFPSKLKGKKIGVVCHAASISSSFTHILDELEKCEKCKIGAIFGPQHGLFGQTQDNMVEWEGGTDSKRNVPVYSLYGKNRKPTPQMLCGLDALVVDLQDVGARPYTYVWTLKLCMEACVECGIPIWVLDRPNPIGCVGFDGPMLQSEFYSFVGGATIPLCHRLTMGEMALLMKAVFFDKADLNIVKMENWWRNSLWSETGLPWVMPSPNMPTLDTAIVYPGMVLLEATNASEGRGTTRPFELFGAPYINFEKFKKILFAHNLEGCFFRENGFIPTFQKWHSNYCFGMQIHVTNPRVYKPVLTTAAIIDSLIKASDGEFKFKDPPYEYETVKMPFDILSGDSSLRNELTKGVGISQLPQKWSESYTQFLSRFSDIAMYPENCK
ncbi:MAG: DUF1343 domain-containing protein [Fibrobacter sp.]|nr:DUF1343 domain-containing protein [Fibrobacter sp.]